MLSGSTLFGGSGRTPVRSHPASRGQYGPVEGTVYGREIGGAGGFALGALVL
jgi:hypothetical protein